MSDERHRKGWQWLTPDELPEDRPLLRGMYLPADSFILGAVTGALELLTEAENWETYGSETPDDTAEYFRALLEEFLAGIEPPEDNGMVPIGAVIAWWSTTPPDGFLRCDYTLYDKDDYPDLYAQLPDHLKISEATFRTPNLIYAALYGYGAADIQAWQTFATRAASGTVWPFAKCIWIIRAE